MDLDIFMHILLTAEQNQRLACWAWTDRVFFGDLSAGEEEEVVNAIKVVTSQWISTPD